MQDDRLDSMTYWVIVIRSSVISQSLGISVITPDNVIEFFDKLDISINAEDITTEGGDILVANKEDLDTNKKRVKTIQDHSKECGIHTKRFCKEHKVVWSASPLFREVTEEQDLNI